MFKIADWQIDRTDRRIFKIGRSNLSFASNSLSELEIKACSVRQGGGKMAMKRRAQRIYHERLLKLLGNKCVICGYSDPRALHIDHISGGGRKELSKGNEAMYRYYLEHLDEAKTRLQVLCANCNFIKRYERSENAWGPGRKVCPECGSPARHKKSCSKGKSASVTVK
jgi:hypothetical protein